MRRDDAKPPCRTAIRPDGRAWPGVSTGCPDCGDPLELSQPAEDVPDRLLGRCPACGAWALVFADSGGVAPLYLRAPAGLVRAPAAASGD